MTEFKDKMARQIVEQLLANDPFSRWLGIELLDCSAGYARIQMTVRDEMLNGFGVGHGGVTFAFADSCFAFASNNHGSLALALDVNITYPAPVNSGDVLIAEAIEESLTRKTAVYSVRVLNGDQQVVALFRGTVFRTSRSHLAENPGDSK